MFCYQLVYSYFSSTEIPDNNEIKHMLVPRLHHDVPLINLQTET